MHVCYQKINADCPSLANTEEDPVQVLSVNVGTLLVNGSLTFFVGSLTRALSQCCTSIKSALITSVPHCCLDIIIRFLIYSISCIGRVICTVSRFTFCDYSLPQLFIFKIKFQDGFSVNSKYLTTG